MDILHLATNHQKKCISNLKLFKFYKYFQINVIMLAVNYPDYEGGPTCPNCPGASPLPAVAASARPPASDLAAALSLVRWW